MKKCLLLLLLATGLVKAGHATEWAWYYVYIQTEYIQGPWTRANLLDRMDSYQYLHPKQYEELYGADGATDMANAIFSHLREETPERYTFHSELSLSGDTVVIQTADSIADFDAVKNELTASFVLNNFAAVKIIQPGKAALYRLQDITVPYMDLVMPGQALRQADSLRDKPDTTPPETSPVAKQRSNTTYVWLILSLVLNGALALLFLRRRK